VSRRIIIAAVLAAAGAAQVQAQAPEGETAARPTTRAELHKQLDQGFARVDTDKDGVISRAEVAALEEKVAAQANEELQRRLDREFAALDSDKNGQLSPAEFKARFTVRRPGPDSALRRLDANKDGRISVSEFKARSLASFDRLDANKDGTITPEEQRKALAR